jgi:hypothetical protein
MTTNQIVIFTILNDNNTWSFLPLNSFVLLLQTCKRNQFFKWHKSSKKCKGVILTSSRWKRLCNCQTHFIVLSPPDYAATKTPDDIYKPLFEKVCNVMHDRCGWKFLTNHDIFSLQTISKFIQSRIWINEYAYRKPYLTMNPKENYPNDGMKYREFLKDVRYNMPEIEVVKHTNELAKMFNDGCILAELLLKGVLYSYYEVYPPCDRNALWLLMAYYNDSEYWNICWTCHHMHSKIRGVCPLCQKGNYCGLCVCPICDKNRYYPECECIIWLS